MHERPIQDEEYGPGGVVRRTGALVVIAVMMVVVLSVVQHFTRSVIAQRQLNQPTSQTKKPNGGKPVDAGQGGTHGNGQALMLEGAGSETAKIKLTGVVDANNTCHGATVAILRAVAEAYPEYVRSDFVDGSSEAGMAVKEKAGVNCQCGVILNGKASIQYDENGKHEEVTFHGPLEWADPAAFSKMLHHFLAAKYPDAPKATLDGLDASVKKIWGGQKGHGAGAGGAAGKAGAPHGMKPPGGQPAPEPETNLPPAGGL